MRPEDFKHPPSAAGLNVKTFLVIQRASCAEIQEYLGWGATGDNKLGRRKGWRITGTGLEFIEGLDRQQPLIKMRYTFVPLGEMARVEIEEMRESPSRLPVIGGYQMRAMEKQARDWLRRLVDNARVAVGEVRQREKVEDKALAAEIFAGLLKAGEERGLSVE